MKIEKMTVEQGSNLVQSIQAVSKAGDNGPMFPLPFVVTLAFARTLKKLQEALEPIQKENERIFEGWQDEVEEYNATTARHRSQNLPFDSIKEAHTASFQRRNNEWKKVLQTEIDVEIFTVPDLNEAAKNQVEKSSIPATLLAGLELVGLMDQF